jgi:hypothetical protein
MHMYFISFSMYVNHKQCKNTIHKCCNNQDHKKNNHAEEHKKYQGKTLLKQGKNPTILCYILKRISPTPYTLEHKRVLTKTYNLAPKRGAHFFRACTCLNSEMTSDSVCNPQWRITFIYSRIDTTASPEGSSMEILD